MPDGLPQYVTDAQLSEMLGITVQTFRQWRQKGEGPPWYKIGANVRYKLEEVEEWIRSNRRLSTSEGGENG